MLLHRSNSTTQTKDNTRLGREDAEALERAPVAFERLDDVERRDRLALRVLRLRDRVVHDVGDEHLDHAPGLFVDERGDALHAATARETADCGLRDALDCVAENTTMALRSALTKPLTTETTA